MQSSKTQSYIIKFKIYYADGYCGTGPVDHVVMHTGLLGSHLITLDTCRDVETEPDDASIRDIIIRGGGVSIHSDTYMVRYLKTLNNQQQNDQIHPNSKEGDNLVT